MSDLISRLLDLTVELQQIPAPTFHEGPRAEFVRRRFEAEGLTDVGMDEVGNVCACRAADEGRTTKDRKRPVIVTAHLDTVFPPSVDLTVHREETRVSGPGIGDNCAGLAGLFGLLWALREGGISLPGDVWLVGNVCEEGLGDLRGMKAVVERFGAEVQAYIVLEGMALGQIYHRGLGVRRYRIRVQTAGGHSWIDYGKPSAVHELARLSAGLTRIDVPNEPRSSLNIGVIAGGTSVNTIAAEAALELDLRSESPGALEALGEQVERISESANQQGVEVTAEVIGRRPAGGIPADAPLVRLAEEVLRSLGENPRRNIGSTDANIPLSRGLPAITIGLTTGGGAHTVHEYINTAPLSRGLDQVVRLVQGVWKV
jgi:acetylornithine deacetylase/succinyl-diaminopimelate desuccinylase-like protein